MTDTHRFIYGGNTTKCCEYCHPARGPAVDTTGDKAGMVLLW